MPNHIHGIIVIQGRGHLLRSMTLRVKHLPGGIDARSRM